MYDILGKNDSKNVSIKIDYLKDEVKLKGPVGARKLLVFNSTRDGKILDTVSDSVTDVNVTATHYMSFTFSTHQTGPYIFVSKTLSKGYIEKLVVEEIVDGLRLSMERMIRVTIVQKIIESFVPTTQSNIH